MVCTFNRQHAHVHSNRFMILSCIAKFINAGRRSTYMKACMCTFRLRCVCQQQACSVGQQSSSDGGDCRSARGLIYAGTNSGYPTLTLGGSGLCHSLDGFSDEASNLVSCPSTPFLACSGIRGSLPYQEGPPRLGCGQPFDYKTLEVLKRQWRYPVLVVQHSPRPLNSPTTP